MKKKMSIVIAWIIIIVLTMGCFFYIKFRQSDNFFKTTYIGANNQEMFIPRYSLYKGTCCMYSSSFYSLKSKKTLEREIKEYMKDFEYFNDEHTYGFKKGDTFIQSYKVEDKGLFRIINIVY